MDSVCFGHHPHHTFIELYAFIFDMINFETKDFINM